MKETLGNTMYQWAVDLFPICRSITGQGVRDTLGYLQNLIPNLTIKAVATGTQVFDWEIPREWNVFDAYIEDAEGTRIIDFKDHNLHLMGYSEPINKSMVFSELKNNLYTLEEMPEAIPYVTSYYQRRWGFCLTHKQYLELNQKPDENFKVVIDSRLDDGHLNYAELLIPGETEEEIFLSTYVCHPSMANNELSGPVVATALARSIVAKKGKHRYSYRFVFIPETIGSITYLAGNLKALQKNVIAGFNITCVGDDRTYSYLPSRQENTLADRAALHALKHLAPDFKAYSFLERGSDERQYCSPGVDLPVCSIMRSKYGEYPEYHTSLDDLSLISPEGLEGAFRVIHAAIDCIEQNEYLMVTVMGEPQLGKRGLYPTTSTKESLSKVIGMMNFVGYCDGTLDAIAIAEKINMPLWELSEVIEKLKSHQLLTA